MYAKILSAGILFLCLNPACAAQQAAKEVPTAAPVITASYAAPEIRMGETWKIYLNAYDPDGEMTRIFGTVEQPGQLYPVSVTRVKRENAKGFSGYLYLSTAPPAYPVNGMTITLTIQVQDRSGNLSLPISFPLTIHNLAVQVPPPPWV
ncbi:MAG TPA: hypothetical protein VLS90_17180, partial [Thermodesulfobacteriota bacterium]|nr:hypothetical protein [Thermodesulfobacteriota bacterium]